MQIKANAKPVLKYIANQSLKLLVSNKFNKIQTALQPYLPETSLDYVSSIILETGLLFRITNPRNSKYGDFKVHNEKPMISVNGNLNSYSFLITTLHEIAHFYVYKQYGWKRSIAPHGIEWKNFFKELMNPVLSADVFPEDILPILKKHMLNPKSSTSNDVKLLKVLKSYDPTNNTVLLLEDINFGDHFSLNGKLFEKKEKLRTRFLCKSLEDGRLYRVHPLAEIDLL